MATYWRVSPKFWSDPAVTGWEPDLKLAALYLLTCPHRTAEGLFRLPAVYMGSDMAVDVAQAEAWLDGLESAGFIMRDRRFEYVLIVEALKYAPTANDKHAKGAVAKLLELHDTPLLAELRNAAERYDHRLAGAMDAATCGQPWPTDTDPEPYDPVDNSTGNGIDTVSAVGERLGILSVSDSVSSSDSVSAPTSRCAELCQWFADRALDRRSKQQPPLDRPESYWRKVYEEAEAKHRTKALEAWERDPSLSVAAVARIVESEAPMPRLEAVR